MIVGIGCDIVDISRIDKLLQSKGDQFLKKVCTKHEIESAPLNSLLKISYFAKRFAAKEAFSKALGTGIGSEIAFNEIEVRNDESGKPFFHFSTDKYSDLNIQLSLSDEKSQALAFVIIEK